MKQLPIYVAGEFVTTPNIFKVYNSYNNQEIAETYLAGKNELNAAIKKAEEAAKKMKNLPAYKKYEILTEIAQKIKQKKQYLADILAQEASKPMKYALGEIERAIQTFIIAAEEAKRLPKEYLSIDWTKAGENKEGFVKYFPIGLIAGIAPFNFPLNLAVHKIAPALASGNSIILKPARSTPLSTLELAKIIDETELPKGALSVLPMNRIAGNQLVTDERFKLLTFTGSPEVGWEMKNNAGKKRVVLELGGNAGVAVSKTADIEHAVNRCLIGGFAYSGQVCIHVQRIYVHKDVFNEFSTKFVEKVQKLKVGDPLDINTDISAMIDENNAKRIEAWVNEAVDNGVKILCGGKRKNAYYDPTVLTETKNEMKVCSMEVFGPVVTLEKVDTFTQAVYEINQSEYGLQAGIFTDSQKEINFAYNDIEVGGLIVNDVPTFRVDHMPYGGVKNSGLGREGLKYAIAEMMEPRLLVKNIL